MSHPALAGYYLSDEPGVSAFPDLAALAKRIRATDDEHFCYINLFPNYASAEQLGVEDYREYVTRFDKEVPLQIMSFDSYPISSNTKIYGNWYNNLEIFSDVAKKAQKPFWAFALSVTYNDAHFEPTLGILRVQVYSNLLYGAQGIQYFTYWTPRGGDYRLAPISIDGKRNPIFDLVKQMNEELKNLSGVFYGAKVISVHHVGSNDVPKGTRRLDKLPSLIKVLETNGAGAILSELENGENSFFVILNKDYEKSMNLIINTDPSVKRVLKDGSIVPVNVYANTIRIEPGDVAVYMYPRIQK